MKGFNSINVLKKKKLGLMMVALLFVSGLSLMPARDVKADTLPVGEGDSIVFGETVNMPTSWKDYYYTLTVPSSGTVKFTNVGEDTIWELEINDCYGKNVGSNSYIGATDSKTFYLRKGQYAVRVKTMNHVTDKFAFYFSTANESFEESDEANNDTEETAYELKALNNAQLTGVFSPNDTNDWYSFTLDKKSMIDLVLKDKTASMGEHLQFKLLDVNGDEIAQSDYYLKDKYSYALDKGSYKLRIYDDNRECVGIYNFSLKVNPIDTATGSTIKTAPSVKVKSKSKLNISWKKYLRANGYQVQVSTNKKFKNAKVINVGPEFTKATYSVKKSQRGKKIYVKVRVFVNDPKEEKLYSSWSKVKTVTTKKK